MLMEQERSKANAKRRERALDDKRKAELEAHASLGETSLWIEALAEDAESEEVEHLTGVLNTEVGRFLEDSPAAEEDQSDGGPSMPRPRCSLPLTCPQTREERP
jgi:hypothetical protein